MTVTKFEDLFSYREDSKGKFCKFLDMSEDFRFFKIVTSHTLVEDINSSQNCLFLNVSIGWDFDVYIQDMFSLPLPRNLI